jgi:hypothetical protein
LRKLKRFQAIGGLQDLVADVTKQGVEKLPVGLAIVNN